MTHGKRDYKKEKAWEDRHPQRMKDRVSRNQARAVMEKAGKVHKGDNKQVDHTKPLSTGGSTSRSNLRVVSDSKNQSFSRNRDGSLKSQTSKRER